MKKIHFNPLTFIFVASLLSGCANYPQSTELTKSGEATPRPAAIVESPSLTNDAVGREHFLTNLNIVVWVPNQATRINDGPTTTIKVDEISPQNAFVEDYSIQLEIRSIRTERQFRQHSEWSLSDWYYQEHLNLSTQDGKIGQRIRKDVWNSQKTEKLFIYAIIKPSPKSAEHLELVKKMVDSVRLIPN